MHLVLFPEVALCYAWIVKKKKNLHAVALGGLGGKARAAKLTAEELSAIGRMGGKEGGKARAAKLSKQERSESARRAAEARWRKYREAKAAEERGR